SCIVREVRRRQAIVCRRQDTKSRCGADVEAFQPVIRNIEFFQWRLFPQDQRSQSIAVGIDLHQTVIAGKVQRGQKVAAEVKAYQPRQAAQIDRRQLVIIGAQQLKIIGLTERQAGQAVFVYKDRLQIAVVAQV